MKSKILAILALSSLLTTAQPAQPQRLILGHTVSQQQIDGFNDNLLNSAQQNSNSNAFTLKMANKLYETTRNWSSKPTWGQYLHYGTYIMAGIGAHQFFLNNFTLNKTNNLIASIVYGSLLGIYYTDKHKVLKTDFEKNKDAYKEKLNEITPTTSTLIASPGTPQAISADDITELTNAHNDYSQELHYEQTNKNLYHWREKVTTEKFNNLAIAPVNAAYQSELQKKCNRDLLFKAGLFAATTGAVIYYCKDDVSKLIQKF